MATATKTIGPADAGLAMSWDEFFETEFQEGYRYELIDGRLVVAATPNTRHSICWEWLHGSLFLYSRRYPKIINHLSGAACVVVPGRKGLTIPEPDIAAFRDFPVTLALSTEIDWRSVSPILVAEIISPDTADKDLFRNVVLYEAVPSIREYWIVDSRGGIQEMTFRVYRKRGGKWQRPIDYHYG